MIDPGMENLPPPAAMVARKKLRVVPPPHIKREAESEDEDGGGGGEQHVDFENTTGRREITATAANAIAVGARGAERRRATHAEKAAVEEEEAAGVPQAPPLLALLSLYEEKMLLRRLDSCPLALAVTPQARRLRRKLLVRQAKRQRGLALLDIDRTISATLSLVGGIYGSQEAPMAPPRGVGLFCTNSRELRILDRFQVGGDSAGSCSSQPPGMDVRSSLLTDHGVRREGLTSLLPRRSSWTSSRKNSSSRTSFSSTLLRRTSL